MIYTGSAHRKITAPYVQSGVDSILRPAICSVARYVAVMCVAADLGTPALLLYSPGEVGVLVGYKVEILVGLHEENPIWTKSSSLFTVGNLMGPASTESVIMFRVDGRTIKRGSILDNSVI